jgi:replication factor A1
MWGDDAINFNGDSHPAMLLKSVRVGEYGGGKTLGTISNTVIKLNPEIPEADQIRKWYDSNSEKSNFVQLSARSGQGNASTDWVTLHDAFKIKNMGSGDKPDYLQICGMIHTVRSNNMVYKACPKADCNKKLQELDGNSYRCEKCNLDTYEFKYRMLVNVSYLIFYIILNN